MPSGSAAQVRHWYFFGIGERYSSCREFKFLILIVDDLEEEHPTQLADALGVAVDANILAHNVLDGLDEGADGHHAVS